MGDLFFADSDGNVYCCYGTEGNTFKAMEKVSGVKVSCDASSMIVDWNEDGLLDFVVAAGQGMGDPGIFLFLNSGTKKEYKFTSSTKLQAGTTNITDERPTVQVADLTNDGKKDLIVTVCAMPEGSIELYENIGSNNDPKFDKKVLLLNTEGKELSSEISHQICVSDWNNDGSLDIIYGGYRGDDVGVYINQSPTKIISGTFFHNNMPILYSYRGVFNVPFVLDQDISGSPGTLYLFNSAGRQMPYTQTISGNGNSFIITTNHLSTGIFYVLLKQNNITREMFKLYNY